MSVVRASAASAPSRQRGVTLLEVLIAALILSIGVLGVVRLITLSKVSQHEAMQRTRAVILADAMLERMRSNPSAMASYAAGASVGSPINGSSIETEPSPDCETASCNPAELAAHDLWLWEQELDGASERIIEAGVVSNAAGLRSLQACIEFAADTGKTSTGIVNVILQWQGLRSSFDAVAAGETACGGAAAGEDDTRRQVVVSSFVLQEFES